MKETKEDTGKKRIREEEKEENEMVIVERRCVNSVSTEDFEIFQVRERFRRVVVISGVTCGVSDCDSGTGTSVLEKLVVAVVLVSPFFGGD